MASMISITQKEHKELKENSYRYHRMMTRLGRTGMHSETDFEVACLEIGRLQGFKQGIEAAVRLLTQT